MARSRYPTQRDLTDPAGLERAFRRFGDEFDQRILKLQSTVAGINIPPPATPPPPPPAPAPPSGPTITTVPNYPIELPSPVQAVDGQLAYFDDKLWRFESDPSPGRWIEITLGGGSTTTPNTTGGPNGTTWQSFSFVLTKVAGALQFHFGANSFFTATPPIPYCSVNNPSVVDIPLNRVGPSDGALTGGAGLNESARNQILMDTMDILHPKYMAMVATIEFASLASVAYCSVLHNDPALPPLDLGGVFRYPLILQFHWWDGNPLYLDSGLSDNHNIRVNLSGWLLPLPA